MALKQVKQSLSVSPASGLAGLIAALRPIIEEHGYTINQLIGETTPFVVTNATVDRTFDANATTTAELADIVATLISDLRAKGVLS